MNLRVAIKRFYFKLRFWLKLLILSPGIIVHELAHLLFCIISGTRVYKFRLFRFSEISGYVEHGEPNDLIGAFLISYGPLFLNSIISYHLFQKFNLN